MKKQFTIKSRGLFDPKSDKPFKISRSGIELFLECPRCFYLNHRLGIRRPSGPPFTINSLVDRLLKKEFDFHRVAGSAHPLMQKYGINAVPFQHPQIDDWRANFKGVQHLHEQTNLLITGAIDDLWFNPENEVMVVDYKATAKSGEVSIDAEWQQSYKRQMEVYQWLVRKQNLKVSDTGYFVYCNGQDAAAFDGRIEFSVKLLPYVGTDHWVEGALLDLKACLIRDTAPTAPETCEYCGYTLARMNYDGTPENLKSATLKEEERADVADEHGYLTERGDLVRRKSEAIIANRLQFHCIDYVYEQPFSTHEGQTLHPDFTITDRSRGITFYWEHLTDLDDPHYREHCDRKHAKYLRAGILPWQEGGGPNGTLIETSDEPDGSLDNGMIDKLVDEIIKSTTQR
jgi:hypothetical protein